MYKGRVIFGELKHRIIKLPDISTTRPTSDALKEAMFNCLIHRFNINFKQWSVIDAFAGSGALGIEALSLGSPLAIFFEQNPIAYNTVRQNIINLGLEEKSVVLRVDVTKYKMDKLSPKLGTKILVILDPPYKKIDVLKAQIINFLNIFDNRELIITVETNDVMLLNGMKPSHTISASGDKKLIIFDKTRS